MAVSKRHRDLFLAAALLTTVLVVLGGVVCVTGASRGCPDWPACYGRLLPPPRMDSIVEYTHRVVAGVTSLAIVATAIVGRRTYRALRWLSGPPAIAVGFLLAVIAFGAMVVLRGLEPGWAALDLGSALVVQALVVTAAVVAVARHKNPVLPDRLWFGSRVARLALGSVIAAWPVFVSGVLVAESGSAVRCLGWPLYGAQAAAGARLWLQGARGVLGVVGVILVLILVVEAWPQRGAMRLAASAAGLFLAAELATGNVLAGGSPTLFLQIAHVALAAVLWASLVTLLVLAAVPSPALAGGHKMAKKGS